MRDVIKIPAGDSEYIVIASDNSGGVGMKNRDVVSADYETVGYFCFRVAVMECIAAGAEPFAAVLHNFCGDNAWLDLAAGVEKGITELDAGEIELTGSTESNFELMQSAVGMSVLGKLQTEHDRCSNPVFSKGMGIAVIGKPLVGEEVKKEGEYIASLQLFREISMLHSVVTLPVGSRGILKELNTLFPEAGFSSDKLESHLNLHKSSGPSTCFIAVYPPEAEEKLKALAKTLFYKISVK
ncbi:ATP-binding protein [Bacillus lacus]|uniref:ATP-binding protein n=1 Tax=Metabacillus lacus TaxID=1983721 RepID=A0A7X2LYM2_9BACI|nr:ATP-binding protein [Metabacillus lacus]MRX72501.1 ATP-binding protein [Metabacillus lacus]